MLILFIIFLSHSLFLINILFIETFLFSFIIPEKSLFFYFKEIFISFSFLLRNFRHLLFSFLFLYNHLVPETIGSFLELICSTVWYRKITGQGNKTLRFTPCAGKQRRKRSITA